jgi:mannonate dehydratase
MDHDNILCRRRLLHGLTLGSAASALPSASAAQTSGRAARGMPPLKIAGVRTILTCPDNIRTLAVVKVETSEPGLYGLGCSTGSLRPYAVKSAVDEYLAPFAKGKDADNIEDLWQTAFVSSYWRNGSILNSALSGLDQALWDIKAKRAGMPLYQLFGGKCRFAVDCYGHAGGRTLAELEQSVRRLMSEGYRHIRIQLGGYGSGHLSRSADFKDAGFGAPGDGHMDVGPYVRSVPEMFEYVRTKCGQEIELLHDIHERIPPMDAVQLIKRLERYRPYFIEDPFSPEDIGYFKILRQQTGVPLAMGELFNSPHEWIGLITERLIDYIRIHISQAGGLSRAMKVARLAEWFNVRTAWHGPQNVSPVGHAVNAHIDLAIWNFGIQESVRFHDQTREVFPGHPTIKNGYLYVNEAPGHGVDLDEKAAAKFPVPPDHASWWQQIRRRDGTSVRP